MDKFGMNNLRERLSNKGEAKELGIVGNIAVLGLRSLLVVLLGFLIFTAVKEASEVFHPVITVIFAILLSGTAVLLYAFNVSPVTTVMHMVDIFVSTIFSFFIVYMLVRVALWMSDFILGYTSALDATIAFFAVMIVAVIFVINFIDASKTKL